MFCLNVKITENNTDTIICMLFTSLKKRDSESASILSAFHHSVFPSPDGSGFHCHRLAVLSTSLIQI